MATASGSGIIDSSSYMERERERLQQAKKSKWTHHHASAFLITFFGYAMFHATRKTFSSVKGTMSAEWSPYNNCCPLIYDKEQWNSRTLFKDDDGARIYLGTLDTVFMIAYAVGLYISGALGDRFDLRKVLAFGMWASSITVFIFGTLSEWVGLRDYYFYILFWLLTGLLQSSGWPCVVAIVGNWFGKSSRGLIMGVWGASPSIGNIIGSYTVSGVILYGYEYAFLVPASMMFAFGIIVFFGVVSSPKDVGLPDPADEDRTASFLEDVQRGYADTDEIIPSDEMPAQPKAIGFFQAFCLPGVLPYSVAYACLKLVNYSFFFWLPYYLESKYKWTEADADSLSTWYDVGGIVGSIVGGIISDRIGTRSPVVGVLLLLGPPSLFIYNASPANKIVNAVLMSITGFFIGGAANLISTTVAADLGKQKEFVGSKESLATVTGIIDGTGSVGAAIGQLLVSLLSSEWSYVFYLFMVMTFLTFVFIIRIIYHDVKEMWLKRKRRTGQSFLGSTQSEDCDPLLGCG